MLIDIKPLDVENELEKLLAVINESFLTVAKDFNLTEENAPANPAFLKMDKLAESITRQLEFFVAQENDNIIGCVGIQPGKNEGEYYLERLAVLPRYRHRGVGKKLLDFAMLEIKKRKAKEISIGIIDENKRLKAWYEKNGFSERSTKKFAHLPFTVCFMEIKTDQA